MALDFTEDSATGEIRPVVWNHAANNLVLLDQTVLPLREEELTCSSTAQLAEAIGRLAVRGAPALGVAGAYGVALALVEAQHKGWSMSDRDSAIDLVRNARPTAVNLAWGVDQVRPLVDEGLDKVLEAAHQVARDDEEANKRL